MQAYNSASPVGPSADNAALLQSLRQQHSDLLRRQDDLVQRQKAREQTLEAVKAQATRLAVLCRCKKGRDSVQGGDDVLHSLGIVENTIRACKR